MPKRGTAIVKKPPSKYIYLSDSSSSGSEEGLVDERVESSRSRNRDEIGNRRPREDQVVETSLIGTTEPPTHQLRQGAGTTAQQRAANLLHLFDNDNDNDESHDYPHFDRRRVRLPPSPLAREAGETPQSPTSNVQTPTRSLASPAEVSSPRHEQEQSNTDPSAEEPTDDMSYIPPSQQRNMRACMVCSIIRTQSQFMQSGCPNCESFLELTGNSDAVAECTSQVFDGMLTVSDTSRSWVARYQRLEGYVAGVYAIQVEGVLPEEVVSAAESAGVHYVPRDGSVSESLPTDG